MKNLFSRGGSIFIFSFILSILFLSVVGAQPPPDTQTNININVGLQIEFTQVFILENGKDHLFNAHVFNISSGLRVDNTTTNCTYHLFDNTGNHQIDQIPMTFDSTGLDWDYNVLGGNFTRNGDYSYLIVCNTTNFGGFLSSGLEVTPTGFTDLLGFYIIIFGVSIIILIIGFWIRDPWVVILGTFGFYFLGLYVLSNGIVGLRDLFMTRTIAIILLAVAAYISIKSAQEAIG